MAEIDVQQMLESMRERLERDQADGKLAGLTIDDLADAISHPKAGAVVAECMEADTHSVAQGDLAPDFTLPWLPGSGDQRSNTLSLSSHFGKRPVALIFGSYT